MPLTPEELYQMIKAKIDEILKQTEPVDDLPEYITNEVMKLVEEAADVGSTLGAVEE